MPDDKPEFTASQRAHAEKIRTERTLMEATGMNRSQLRRLQAFASRVTEAKDLKPSAATAVSGPQITRTESKLGGAGLVPKKGAVEQGVNTNSTGGLVLTLCKDGVPTNYLVVGAELGPA